MAVILDRNPNYDQVPIGERGIRPDEEVEREVRRFLAEGDLHISDLEVHVTSGELALVGRTASYEEKRAAEDAAERVPGVVKIQNKLQVEPAPEGPGGE